MPRAPEATVAGVVLAAGSSTRMGRNKLVLDLGGGTVVRRAVQAALEARLRPVVVVLGHEAERVRAEVADLACRVVMNPDHAQGVATSLHAGVRTVPDDAAALVVVLADMPFVTASMIDALVRRFRTTEAPVVVSRYGETEAPPTLFARPLFPELLATRGERGARAVALRHQREAAVVAFPPEALRDLDVAGDYERVRGELKRG
jgi:molybdenum cofactor cytidylyltransferase